MRDKYFLLCRKFSFSFLLLFSIILISWDNAAAATQGDDNVKTEKKELTQLVKVFYFHTSYRCNTCTRIEQLTKEAIHETFSVEMKEKKFVFEVHDIEVKENEPYIKKYNLITKSVIVSRLIDGQEKKWKNLDKIWTLHRKPEDFKQYIINEIKLFFES